MYYSLLHIRNDSDRINVGIFSACRVRLVTLDLTTMLLKRLVMVDGKSILLDEHYAAVIGAKEESTSLLRNYYKVRRVHWSSGNSAEKIIQSVSFRVKIFFLTCSKTSTTI